MKILATNDDGIDAPGLWAVVKDLQKVGQVVVVAPQQEQSGVGSSVTLRQPIEVEKTKPPLGGVEVYSVVGTPSDCVIIALNLLFPKEIDLVVSGINRGPNIGSDVFISGTVSAALQGYLHGVPSLAISLDAYESLHFEVAAKLAALLATKLKEGLLPQKMLLNINLPNLSQEEITEIEVTTLGKRGYTDVVQRVQGRGCRLMRATRLRDEDPHSDLWALQRNRVSITPLLFDLSNSSNSSLSQSLQKVAHLLYQELHSR